MNIHLDWSEWVGIYGACLSTGLAVSKAAHWWQNREKLEFEFSLHTYSGGNLTILSEWDTTINRDFELYLTIVNTGGKDLHLTKASINGKLFRNSALPSTLIPTGSLNLYLGNGETLSFPLAFKLQLNTGKTWQTIFPGTLKYSKQKGVA